MSCNTLNWPLALALALVLAVSPIADLKAASLLGKSSQPPAVGLIAGVATQKGKTQKAVQHHAKKHRPHRKGKRMHSKGPGRCGSHLYYSRKHGRCKDPRTKS